MNLNKKLKRLIINKQKFYFKKLNKAKKFKILF